MKQEKIYIQNEYDEQLVGTKCIPTENTKPDKAVLLVHGFASDENSSTCTAISDTLAEKGYITYRFSFSGCGKSDGDYSDMTLGKEISELKSVVEFLQTHENIDIEDIGIFAHSFGTASTIGLNPEVKTIVLASASDSMYKFFLNRYRKKYHPQGDSCWIKPSTGENICVGPEFWINLQRYDLQDLACRINTSTLFIHGEKDETIFPHESESLFESVRGAKKYILIENADHKFQPNIQEFCKTVTDWFAKHLPIINSPIL